MHQFRILKAVYINIEIQQQIPWLAMEKIFKIEGTNGKIVHDCLLLVPVAFPPRTLS